MANRLLLASLAALAGSIVLYAEDSPTEEITIRNHGLNGPIEFRSDPSVFLVKGKDQSEIPFYSENSPLGDWRKVRANSKTERDAAVSANKHVFLSPLLRSGRSHYAVSGPVVYVQSRLSRSKLAMDRILEKSGPASRVRVISSPYGTEWSGREKIVDHLDSVKIEKPPYKFAGVDLPPPPPGEEKQVKDGMIIVMITVPAQNGWEVFEFVEEFATIEGVESCEASLVGTFWSSTPPTFSLPPNDPGFNNSWHLIDSNGNGLNVTDAWAFTYGYSSTLVGVLDSGVESDHPDLHLANGRNFADDQAEDNYEPANEHENHGTAVSGVISGIANNGLLGTGVAPNVRVVPLRIGKNYLSDGGFQATVQWIVDAINHAADVGCRVTNSSWGTTTTFSAIDTVFANTRDTHDILHVAASGNDYSSTIGFPSSSSSVVAVGATDINGSRALFSNYGTGLMLSAPGEDIRTTDRTGTDGYNSQGDDTVIDGTSFASPIVAATAALLVSYDPAIVPDQMETAMTTTAQDRGITGYDTIFGHGLVDPDAALASINPGLWISAGCTDLGGGWKWQPQFNSLSDIEYPYYYHNYHDWQFVGSTDPSAYWLYDFDTETWWYTKLEAGQYPIITINGNWYFYYEGTESPREFFDYQTQQIITEDDL
jgi:hypothetical protein